MFAQNLHSTYFSTNFFSFCTLTCLVNMAYLYLCLHVSQFLHVCTLITADKRSQQHFPKSNNEILRKGVESCQS